MCAADGAREEVALMNSCVIQLPAIPTVVVVILVLVRKLSLSFRFSLHTTG
jgi:hypothetical protein